MKIKTQNSKKGIEKEEQSGETDVSREEEEEEEEGGEKKNVKQIEILHAIKYNLFKNLFILEKIIWRKRKKEEKLM